MKEKTLLQTAIVPARQTLSHLLEEAKNRSTPLGELVYTELKTSRAVHVLKNLAKWDVWKAAHLKSASEPFRHGVRELLQPVLSDVIERLTEEWEPDLAGESGYCAHFTRRQGKQGFTRHLPQWVLNEGEIPPHETRLLMRALLADPIMLALWVAQQGDARRSSAVGALTYAANNGAFVERTLVFGRTVNIAPKGADAHNVHECDLTIPMIQERDGEDFNLLDQEQYATFPSAHREQEQEVGDQVLRAIRVHGHLSDQHQDLLEVVWDGLIYKVKGDPAYVDDFLAGKRRALFSEKQKNAWADEFRQPAEHVEDVVRAIVQFIYDPPLLQEIQQEEHDTEATNSVVFFALSSYPQVLRLSPEKPPFFPAALQEVTPTPRPQPAIVRSPAFPLSTRRPHEPAHQHPHHPPLRPDPDRRTGGAGLCWLAHPAVPGPPPGLHPVAGR